MRSEYSEEFFKDNVLAVYNCVYPVLLEDTELCFGTESLTCNNDILIFTNYFINVEGRHYSEMFDARLYVLELTKENVTKLGLTAVSGNITDYTVKCGDITGDKEVNIMDLSTLCKFIANLETPSLLQKAAADIYGDGLVDIRDLVKLLKYIAKFDGIVLGDMS